eukprot:37175-Pelagomonas_calceolata.AAC.1
MEGKDCIAVPACVGSPTEMKTLPVAKTVRAGEQEQYIIKLIHSILSTQTQTWLILGHQPEMQVCSVLRRAIQDNVLFVIIPAYGCGQP